MTTYWKGGDGEWETAADWTDGAPTTRSAFAVINAAGIYTITIESSLEYHVGAVSLNAAGATLALKGVLDLSNKLTVSSGMLALSGRIAGGTIVADGGAINFQGELDDVTYDGTLDLVSTPDQYLTVVGLRMRNADGKAGGAIKIGGKNTLEFFADETLDGGTLSISGGLIEAEGDLTFGRTEKVLYSSKNYALSGFGVVTNFGGIAIGKESPFHIQTFSNSGRFTVNGGFASASKFTNRVGGRINIAAGSSFTVLRSNGTPDVSGFYNQGTFTATDATITLYNYKGNFGNLNIASSRINLSTISDTGTLNTLTHMLAGKNNSLTVQFVTDNYGHSLHLPAPAGFVKSAYAVNITGGTVSIDARFGGHLAYVSYQGTANVIGSLFLEEVSFSGAGGIGSGTMHLNGALHGYFGSAGIDNVTIIAAAKSSIDTGPVDIGVNAKIQALGSFRMGQTTTIINSGTIEADGAAGTIFVLNGRHITNDGTIRVENGGEVLIRSENSLENNSSGTLDGHGDVQGAVANSGLINAAGGTLSISRDLTGTGQDNIEENATLQLDGNVSSGQTLDFIGSGSRLALGDAAGFDGTIIGFAQGDTVNLISTEATAVIYDSGADTLTIKNNATVVATLKLGGDYTGDVFGVTSDSNGGTAITLTGIAPGALHRFTEARAAFSSSDMAATASLTPAAAGWDSAHMLAAAGHA